jgi:hypothetical protein
MAEWRRPRDRGEMARAAAVAWRLAAVGLAVLLAGCTTTRVTVTPRSGIEQLLIVRALERAAADLDVAPLTGRLVALELFGLTADREFARQFVAARLETRGLHIAPDPETAEVTLKLFASAVGVDSSETLVGVPALHVPVVGLPVPEIALFKWARSRGQAEIQLYAYDAATGRFLEQVPTATGRSKFDVFTVLVVVSFTVSDLDRTPEPARRAGD